MKKFRTMLALTLSIMLAAFLFCPVGAAADLAATAPALVYEVADNGAFTKVGDAEVKTIVTESKTYYSLDDYIKISGEDVPITEDTFSEFYFRVVDGDYYTGRKVYDVPVVKMEFRDKSYELHKNTGDITFVEDGSATTYDLYFKEVDGVLYVDAPTLRFMTDWGIVNDLGVNILLTDNHNYPKIAGASNITTANKERVTAAMWLLFNAYYEGYETVVDYGFSVCPVDKQTLVRWSGRPDTVGYAKTGDSRRIYIDKKALENYEFSDLASVLIHEATHHQRFTHRDYREDIPTLNQAKAEYYIERLGTFADRVRTGEYRPSADEKNDPYYNGHILANDWLAEQAAGTVKE